MAYTFWHAGLLIGTSALEHPSGTLGQLGGVFHPTTHGLAVFPRLTGILSAGLALKRHLDARGMSPDDLSPQETATMLETSPAGRKIIDLGRTLGDLEVRDAGGRPTAFASIAFTDLAELRRITSEMALDRADDGPELPPGAPRYIVSVTFRSRAPRAARARIPFPA